MNSDAPLISILVPIYRVEKYIERCARSIFEQTYDNLEILIVDDGTPDNSVEILNRVIVEYPNRKQKTQIIRQVTNRGLAVARNTLVNSSKGEFLMHVDSDDWLEPNAVETLVKRQRETDADIVTGAYCRHFIEDNVEKTKVVAPWEVEDRNIVLEGMLKCGSVVALWNRLIRKSLYDENDVQSIEGVNAGEDLVVTPRLVFFSRKVASCSSVTYHYNRSNSNSFVSLFPHNLDCQKQLIRATLLNVEFFKRKEAHLSKAMEIQYVERLKNILYLNFKNCNYRGYKEVLTMLDGVEREYWPLIGWESPKKRWLDHHFFIARMLFPIRILHGKANQLIKGS